VRDSGRLRSKTLFFATVAVLTNVLGNFALSHGTRQLAEPLSLSIPSLLGALLNGWVAAGIGMLAIWMIAQLSLLSWADLSYVLPLTAGSYVLTALLGAVVLKETISTVHWIGITLISLGVLIVGKTTPRTVAVEAAGSAE
jgi:drug/metabolite transporter (DMT)-like permease